MGLKQRPIRLVVVSVVLSALAVHYGHALFGWFAAGQYDVVDTWVMDGLLVAAASVALAGAWRSGTDRPRRFVLAIGIACYALGFIVYHALLMKNALTFPTAADFLWLALYPAAAVSVVMLLRREIRRGSWLWLDAAVNTLALGAIGWAFVVAPAADAAVTSEAYAIGAASYLVGDLVLAGLLVALATACGLRRSVNYVPLGLAVALLASGDLVYAWRSSAGIDVAGSLTDPVWVSAMLLLAVSCWLKPRVAAPAHDPHELQGSAAVSPFLALLALLAVGTAETDAIADGLVFASVALVCLRLGSSLRANRALIDIVRAAERASAEQARTDPLTSLGNRRALETELSARALSDEPLTVVNLDLNGFKSYNDRFGHAAGDVLLRRLGSSLEAAAGEQGRSFRPGGDEFCVLLRGHVDRGDAPVDAVLAALTEEGLGFSITPACGIVAMPNEARDPDAALRLADERMYGDKRNGRKSPAEEMSELLSRVVAEREPNLHEHSADVVALALGVARRVDCSNEELDLIARAAEQHDVGKLAIPDAILLKPGRLDPGEWDLVRQHTIVGERILAGTPALRPVARVVRSCHEHWDGSGYPDGLAGRGIPLAARIIAICDAFSAMVTDRPYRSALSNTEAFAELKRCSGTQFDRELVEPLIQSVDETSALALAPGY